MSTVTGPIVDLLTVHATWTGSAVLVEVRGEIDNLTAPALDGELADLLERAPDRVALDCSGVMFVSLAGLRALSAAGRTLRSRGGALVVIDPPSTLSTILRALHVDVPFDVVTSSGAGRARRTDRF